MGNFEKLGILVIIVLVVVILVLAVWGMEVQPNDQVRREDDSLTSLDKVNRSGGEEADRERVGLDPSDVADRKKSGRNVYDWTDGPVKEPPVTPDPDKKDSPEDDPDAPVVEPAVKPADLKHTIVKGDNFYDLAKRYYGNVKYWGVIRDANPGVNPARMQLDVELTIPHPDTVLAKKATPRKTASTPRPNAEPPSGRTYTVRKGETLSAIALHLLGSKTDWRKLYDANRAKIGPDPDRVSEGMVLVVP